MAAMDPLVDAGWKALNAGHRALRAVTGGRLGKTFGSMPAIELRTIGRSTGRRRSTILTSPVHDVGRYVVVASKGGDDRAPDWYRNLVAEPDVEITVDGATIPVRARTATAQEKAELWPRIIAAYAGYAHYQRRSARDIPVVILEPREP
jgi:deazaflavin-dependent oxidoreductase (nitroreductase family)